MKRYLVFSIIFLMSFIGIIQAETYKPGDVITYKDIKFYVVEDKGDYLTLLKAKPLTWDEAKEYGDGYINKKNPEFVSELSKFYYDSEYATVAYYTNDNCKFLVEEKDNWIGYVKNSDCKNDYKESDIKHIIDNWSNKVLDQNDLKEVGITYNVSKPGADYDTDNGDNLYHYETVTEKYKVRLITMSEYNNIYNTFSNKGLTSMFGLIINRYPFWTMDITERSLDDYQIDDKNYYNNIEKGLIQTNYGYAFVGEQSRMIRPVIHLSKSASFTSTKRTAKKKTINDKEFKVGDVVRYNNMDFYVLKDSNASDNQVTMIKAIPLTTKEIDNLDLDINGTESYHDDITDASYKIGKVEYYIDDNCRDDWDDENNKYTKTSSCTTDYKKSYVKKVVDEWVKEELNGLNLVEDKLGYKSRLITLSELTEELLYKARNEADNRSSLHDSEYYAPSDDTPFSLGQCWTMTTQDDYNYLVYRIKDQVKLADYPSRNIDWYNDENNTKYNNSSILTGSIGGVVTTNVASSGAVCPVITINKLNPSITKVNVPNTLLKSPIFIAIIGIILIVGSIVTFAVVLKRKNNVH